MPFPGHTEGELLFEIHELVKDIPMIADSVRRHERALSGNGDPGLIKSVERLNQTLKLLMWVSGLFAAGAIPAFLNLYLRR